MTIYPPLHPTWVANIQRYGPTIVNVVTNINATNRLLWENTESAFYDIVGILAYGWNLGLNLQNAIYLRWQPHREWSVLAWRIPATSVHQYQHLIVTTTGTPYVQSAVAGDFLTEDNDTPNLRSGYTIPANITHVVAVCSNRGIVLWHNPPTPPTPPTPVDHPWQYKLDMILYPTPWVQWDQSWDMDMFLKNDFEKPHEVDVWLLKHDTVSYTLTSLLLKNGEVIQNTDVLVQGPMEQQHIMGMNVLANPEVPNELTMVLVTWVMCPYSMTAMLKKDDTVPQSMSAKMWKEIDMSHSMDMRLIKVPIRPWIIPQIWNLQDATETDSNSTGPTFDSHRSADRIAAGGSE